MKKSSKIIIIIVIVAVLSFIIWKIIQYRNKKKIEAELKPAETPTDNAGSPISNWTNDSFPLRKWSKGSNVTMVQRALNGAIKYLGISSSNVLVADGYYGDKTVALTKALQTYFKMPVTGEINEYDFNKYIKPLFAVTNTPPAGASAMSPMQFLEYMYGKGYFI